MATLRWGTYTMLLSAVPVLRSSSGRPRVWLAPVPGFHHVIGGPGAVVRASPVARLSYSPARSIRAHTSGPVDERLGRAWIDTSRSRTLSRFPVKAAALASVPTLIHLYL